MTEDQRQKRGQCRESRCLEVLVGDAETGLERLDGRIRVRDLVICQTARLEYVIIYAYL